MDAKVSRYNGEFSKDLSCLIIKAASAAGTKNWAEIGEESAKRARARYLRMFGTKIALAAVRQQAIWMCGRLEQVRMQKAGGSGPTQRAKTQRWRAKMAQQEYWDTHAGFASADWRRS